MLLLAYLISDIFDTEFLLLAHGLLHNIIKKIHFYVCMVISAMFEIGHDQFFFSLNNKYIYFPPFHHDIDTAYIITICLCSGSQLTPQLNPVNQVPRGFSGDPKVSGTQWN